MAIQFYSANTSQITADSEPLEGVQSIEWKVNRNVTDVPGIGFGSTSGKYRQGVNFGQLEITGKIRIKTISPKIDERLFGDNPSDALFNMTVALANGMKDQAKLTVNFTDVVIHHRELAMDTNGVAISVYTFSATDMKEE